MVLTFYRCIAGHDDATHQYNIFFEDKSKAFIVNVGDIYKLVTKNKLSWFKKTKKKREYPRQRKKKKVEEENQDGDQHHTPTVIEVKSMSDGVAVAFSPAISKTKRKTTGMKRLQDDGKDQVDAAQTRAHHTHTISKLQSSTEEHF